MKYEIPCLEGKEVARLLVDHYLNSYARKHGEFMEAMVHERKEVQENFTYLVFAWLNDLSETRYYDERNAASVSIANDICRHMKVWPRLHLLSGGNKPRTEVVDVYDGAEVEAAMAGYLASDSKNAYQDFIRYALGTHRTLQQNLTRFFLEWLEREKKNFPAIKGIRTGYRIPFI